MGCCAGTDYDEKEINGECSDCGTPTVDGQAFEQCSYSEVVCHNCGHAPCDQSC